MPKKTSVTIYLLESQYNELHALKKATRVPVSEYIRQGIDRVLELEGASVLASTALPAQKPEGG
jgi:hypothetical protein